jgi:hypothetical protein
VIVVDGPSVDDLEDVTSPEHVTVLQKGNERNIHCKEEQIDFDYP